MSSPNQSSLEMLATALEMEEKGRAFYQRAVNSCPAPQCKEIFQALAEEEIIHTQRIKQIHSDLTAKQSWTRAWESIKGSDHGLGALFRELGVKAREKITAETSDLEAIDIGLDFEIASIKFYQDHQAKSVDPLESAFLEQMIREEKEHWKALKDTRYYLTDPQGWFMEKERAGLDGE